MNKTVRNILAVVAGIVIGNLVNMSLVNAGYALYPTEGLDPNDMESIKEAMKSFTAINFLFPFLAHALGTFAGAFIAAKIAATHKWRFAMAFGIIYFIGGVIVSFMLPAPAWFITVDLLFAYFPFAWMAGKLAKA